MSIENLHLILAAFTALAVPFIGFVIGFVGLKITKSFQALKIEMLERLEGITTSQATLKSDFASHEELDKVRFDNVMYRLDHIAKP